MNNLEKLYLHYQEHSSVSTDTRTIKPGDIFFALRGDQFNGNRFASEAIQKGASLVVVDEEPPESPTQYLKVNNVLETLQKLSVIHRDNLKAKVIGITGSNGKTTTKELIHKVLSSEYKTQATQGNLNNHIGVPLTLLSINKNTDFAIVEMGANHIGEIAELCKFAKPGFGLITNIGKAHLEGFGSLEGVIRAKSELYDFLRQHNGTVFLNADNPTLVQQAQGINQFAYGTAESFNCSVKYLLQNPFLELGWYRDNNWNTVSTQIYGKYNAENITAAIAVGQYFNVPKQSILKAIKDYVPSNNRSQVITTKKKNTVILDAYNANPTSLELALRGFATFPSGNKYVILGDMFEVGTESEAEHIYITKLLNNLKFNHVILVGNTFHSLNSPGNWMKFPDVQELQQWLRRNEISNHAILIKGSRKVGLEKILELL